MSSVQVACRVDGPQRIQLSRRAGWRMPENTVKVDRTNKTFGNPFRVGDPDPETGRPMDAARAVELFRARSAPSLQSQARHHLRGMNLACWCALGAPCHADVLLAIANG